MGTEILCGLSRGGGWCVCVCGPMWIVSGWWLVSVCVCVWGGGGGGKGYYA